ncbi:hypothetical protein ACVWXO_007250 [Bradyrhizobium sp. LM2.7]
MDPGLRQDDTENAAPAFLDQTFGTINATNLKRAHALQESGKSHARTFLFEHDLVGSPLHAFPDHALARRWC